MKNKATNTTTAAIALGLSITFAGPAMATNKTGENCLASEIEKQYTLSDDGAMEVHIDEAKFAELKNKCSALTGNNDFGVFNGMHKFEMRFFPSQKPN